jgi:hypothetical protein
MANAKPTPSDDFEAKTFWYQNEAYRVKPKFKIFKFFKALNENPVTAIELAVEEDDFARLEELEIDMEDFKVILEGISDALAGTNSGN